MTQSSKPSHGQTMRMRAVLLGERLDHRLLERVPGATADPVQMAFPVDPIRDCFTAPDPFPSSRLRNSVLATLIHGVGGGPNSN